jgi:hypothetical protein
MKNKMQTSIKIIFKDGTERDFPHRERPGGSFTKRIRYEGGFAIITDEYYHETAFPSENIKEVRVTNHQY